MVHQHATKNVKICTCKNFPLYGNLYMFQAIQHFDQLDHLVPLCFILISMAKG